MGPGAEEAEARVGCGEAAEGAGEPRAWNEDLQAGPIEGEDGVQGCQQALPRCACGGENEGDGGHGDGGHGDSGRVAAGGEPDAVVLGVVELEPTGEEGGRQGVPGDGHGVAHQGGDAVSGEDGPGGAPGVREHGGGEGFERHALGKLDDGLVEGGEAGRVAEHDQGEPDGLGECRGTAGAGEGVVEGHRGRASVRGQASARDPFARGLGEPGGQGGACGIAGPYQPCLDVHRAGPMAGWRARRTSRELDRRGVSG